MKIDTRFLAACVVLGVSLLSANAGPRKVVSLDENWSFRLGKLEPQTALRLDDGSWRTVDVPHDYVVEGTFSQKDTFPDAASSRNESWYAQHGSLPTSPAVYCREIDLGALRSGCRLWLEFDGVFSNSRFYLNGREIGSQYSGYTRTRLDISDSAKLGEKNLLVVEVDPRYDGWWYEGGGIYRHVRLVVVDKVHVSPDGVFIVSEVNDPRDGLRADATVRVSTDLSSFGDTGSSATLLTEVLEMGGRSLGSKEGVFELKSGSSVTAQQEVPLRDAFLWSVDHPTLYRLRSVVSIAGRIVDEVTTTFGVRVVQFDSERGFFLNGRPMKIHGVNLHQDHAGVGVAMPDRLFTWRLERLKEIGCNAIRLSHNPVSPYFLDECDRMGFLVVAENRHLGDTSMDQTTKDVPAVEHRDLRDLVMRDRNHPSVIAWSLCNEQWIQGSPEAAAMARSMRECVRKIDPSRPVTAALNGGFDSAIGLASELDLIGINYNPEVYDKVHALFPGKPMVATETASELGTRGVYANEHWDSFVGDRTKGYLSSYGLNALATDQPAIKSWAPVAARSFIGGGFVWAGFDYKGEPKPFEWPCINSHLGLMDICGFPKDMYYFYKAAWSDVPVLHVFPHWNWAGKEGQEIPVWVYTNCEEAELFLNGVSLGKKMVPDLDHVEWNVRYAPGTLVAKGRRKGVDVETKIETVGAPHGLRLAADRIRIVADNHDLVVVNLEIVDARGRVVPTGSNKIRFGVTGPARLIGVGNGDPSCHEEDKATSRSAFNGLAQAIVQSTHTSGVVTISAESDGLEPSHLEVVTGPAPLQDDTL